MSVRLFNTGNTNRIQRGWSCDKSDSGNLGCDYLFSPVASKSQCTSVLPVEDTHNVSFLLCFAFVCSLIVNSRNKPVFLCVLSQCLESKLALAVVSSRAASSSDLYLLRSISWRWAGSVNEGLLLLSQGRKKEGAKAEEWGVEYTELGFLLPMKMIPRFTIIGN